MKNRKDPMKARDLHSGFALKQSPVEVEIVEGYSIIVQETYDELSNGREGLTMPDYETYRAEYLGAVAAEASE